MDILIYGSNSYAQLIAQLSKECGYNVIGFIDDFSNGDNIVGDFEIVKRTFSPQEIQIAIGVGYKNLAARQKLMDNVLKAGYKLPNLIHPTAYISSTAKIGQGCVLMAKTIIDFESILENGVVCWPGVIINHNCEIDSNVFLSPAAVVCGFVKIEANTFIGANSTIVNNCVVEENSFIKAGSIYKKDGE